MKADKEMNKGDTFLWNTQCRFLYFDAFYYMYIGIEKSSKNIVN